MAGVLPKDITAENIVIIVGDAVRWDVSKERLATYGTTFKTVAASLHTPTSFATFLSGKRPFDHGVYGFHQKLRDDDHIFNLDGYESAYAVEEKGSITDWLFEDQNVFGDVPAHRIEDIDTPFIWVDRDFGGHAPYNQFDGKGNQTQTNSCGKQKFDTKEYFENVRGDVDKIQSEYENSIDSFFQRVDNTIEKLSERGILDETLVVIMSDHGELLGEYGQIGHDYPAVPELVYVPTTFVHPELDATCVKKGIARHIDLLPTLEGLSDVSFDWELPGRDLTRQPTSSMGVNYYNRSISDYVHVAFSNERLRDYFPNLRLEIQSLWERDGGIVFNTSVIHERLFLFLMRCMVLPQGEHIRQQWSYKRVFDTLVKKENKYGSPSFSTDEARETLHEYINEEMILPNENYELSEADEDQLRDLGYL